MRRQTITLGELHPGLSHHLIQDRLGKPGQMVAHLHQRQGADYIGGTDPQQLDLFELPQRLHLLLHILLRHPQQVLAQLLPVLIQRRGVVELLGIQQLIQQYGVTGQLLGHHLTGITQLQQLVKHARVFHQQLQIGRAGNDLRQQRLDSLKEWRRTRMVANRLQQAWHQAVERLAPLRAYGSLLARLMKTLPVAGQGLGILGTQGGEEGQALLQGQGGEPEIVPDLRQIVRLPLLLTYDGDELSVYLIHHLIQRLVEADPIPVAQHSDEAQPIPLALG